MEFALNLAPDCRILSATFAKFANSNFCLVDNLPDGDITDYKYANGNYIFDPIIVDPPPYVPTIEERTAALEAATMALMGGV